MAGGGHLLTKNTGVMWNGGPLQSTRRRTKAQTEQPSRAMSLYLKCSRCGLERTVEAFSECPRCSGSLAPATGSAKDDGRVYEYTGTVGVLRGSIIIPRLDDAPREGQYNATIVLWPNTKLSDAKSARHSDQ